jgi:hypothetical protein
LSGISGKIIMAEQVRPGYPKENGLTKPCVYLPKSKNTNDGNVFHV